MQNFEDYIIENSFLVWDEKLNGPYNKLYEKILEFFKLNEEYLGIKDIDKKTYKKYKHTKSYWALFADKYEKGFGKADNPKEVEKTKQKMLKKTSDQRVIDAIEFFAEFRLKELELLQKGIDIDNLSYLQILSTKIN